MTENLHNGALEQFKKALANSNKHVFSPSDIIYLIVQARAEYPFPRSLSERKFQKSLIDSGVLKEISLSATHSFETTRYHFGPFSDYELALSLKTGAYLSHGTAAHLHSLLDQKPRIVLLSGKHTGRLGVTKTLGPQGEQLELTDLERTLIDIAVRPTYAGGA